MLIIDYLLWGFNILYSFRREVGYYFQIAIDSKKHYKPEFTVLWGTACLRFIDFYAIWYPVLLRTDSMIIYDFSKYSIDTARGSGGGRGPKKNISIVDI